MVVEELLQFLICEVNAKLLQAVELIIQQKQLLQLTLILYVLILSETFMTDAHIKDLKSSDVQHTNEELSRLLGVQHLIDTDDHPQEHFLIDRLAECRDCIVHLRNSKVIVE